MGLQEIDQVVFTVEHLVYGEDELGGTRQLETNQ